MDNYRHVLVAVDFMPDHAQVTDRAAAIARQNGARLSLVHVVEYLHMDLAEELVLPQDLVLEEQLMEAARKRLDAIAATLEGGEAIERHVALGQTRQEILRVAEEQNADLIVLGRHGRHGIGRLLGSTANAVLQHAPCDVLAVRLREPAE